MNKFTLLFILFLFSCLYGIKSFAQGVAINTTGATPNCMLDVRASVSSGTAIKEVLRIQRDYSDVAGANGIGCSQTFYLENNLEGTMAKAATIQAMLDNATNTTEDGTLVFNVSRGGTLKESMRCDGTLNFIGINQSSPSARLDVKDGLSNNTQTEVVRIERENTGVATAGGTGIGETINFYLENSVDGTLTKAGAVGSVFDVATSGSEEGSLTLAYAQNNVLKEGMRVDGTAGYVGINTITPSARLDVVEGSLVDNTTLEVLRVERINSTAATGGAVNIGASEGFYLESSTDGTMLKGGSIDVILENVTAASEVGSMLFKVAQSGTVAEAMRVDGTSGYVGIGQTNPQAPLHVTYTDDAANTVPMIKIERTKKTGAGVASQGAAFQYFLEDDGGNSVNVVSLDAVQDVATAGNNQEATLRFLTKIAGSGTVAEQMRIDGTAGYIGMGATNPLSKLDVVQDDNNNTVLQVLTLERNKTTGAASANGIGEQIAFLIEDGGAALQEHADIDARLINYTDGSEDAAIEFRCTTDGTTDKMIMGIIGDQGGAVTFFGGVEYPVRSVSGNGANTTLDRSDYFIKATATGAADYTVNLPPVNGTNIVGHVYVIKRMNATAGNDIIIDANGTETIDGAITLSLLNQYDCATLISNGTEWSIMK